MNVKKTKSSKKIILKITMSMTLIKGVYKDHLVEWVSKYLEHVHGIAGGARVIDEIDRR